MKVTIKKTGINGEGIGYIDRMPVFVPQALIGEELVIRYHRSDVFNHLHPGAGCLICNNCQSFYIL